MVCSKLARHAEYCHFCGSIFFTILLLYFAFVVFASIDSFARLTRVLWSFSWKWKGKLICFICFTVCPQKTESTTFRHSIVKPQLNVVIFGSDTRDSCESAYDCVFHLTSIMPIPGIMFQTSHILAIIKTVDQ